MNEEKIENLLYIGRKIGKTNTKQIFKKYKLISERVLLYQDFMLLLSDIVVNKYPGRESMTHQDNINHFNWAINKTIDIFKQEHINFTPQQHTITYIFNLYNTIFYDYTSSNLKIISAYIQNIMDIETPKSDGDIMNLTILYEMFEEMLIYK